LKIIEIAIGDKHKQRTGYAIDNLEDNILREDICEKHGETWFLYQFNQGGYDATSLCVECMMDIYHAVKEWEKIRGIK
jgi:hypothetical protein